MVQHRQRIIKHGYEKAHCAWKWKKKLIAACSIAGVGLSITFYLPTLPIAGGATVIDGDTLVVDNQTIRLYGIDAPEIKQPCYGEGTMVQCGVASKRQIQTLLGEGTIVQCTPKGHDRYKRTVAICRVGDKDINAAMVRTGYALAYTAYSTKYILEEKQAQTNKEGIWSYRFDKPWEWRKSGSSSRVQATIPH